MSSTDRRTNEGISVSGMVDVIDPTGFENDPDW
jgi:hypothetical protein